MYSLGNVDHSISIVGYWIFEFKYEKALFLQKNRWIQYALLPLVKNNLQRFDQYFILLDTFGHQFILKG